MISIWCLNAHGIRIFSHGQNVCEVAKFLGKISGVKVADHGTSVVVNMPAGPSILLKLWFPQPQTWEIPSMWVGLRYLLLGGIWL